MVYWNKKVRKNGEIKMEIKGNVFFVSGESEAILCTGKEERGMTAVLVERAWCKS